jgi:hypothetical protein
MVNSYPSSDPIRYQTIAAAAQLLAEGNRDEWSYLFNQIRTHTKGQEFVTLILKMREELTGRLEGPVTLGGYFWGSTLLGKLIIQ